MKRAFQRGVRGWGKNSGKLEPSQIVSGFLNFLHKNSIYLGGESTNSGPMGIHGNVPYAFLQLNYCTTMGYYSTWGGHKNNKPKKMLTSY
jgi:hypothetical protein